jgi:hypothetical protein
VHVAAHTAGLLFSCVGLAAIIQAKLATQARPRARAAAPPTLAPAGPPREGPGPPVWGSALPLRRQHLNQSPPIEGRPRPAPRNATHARALCTHSATHTLCPPTPPYKKAYHMYSVHAWTGAVILVLQALQYFVSG